jgi:hypothetical protein
MAPLATRSLKSLAALLLLLMPLGCGGPRIRTASIKSDPSGAVIYVNGEKQGTTPSVVQLIFRTDDPTERVLVQLRMEGFVTPEQYWRYTEVPPEGKLFELTHEQL